MSFEKTVPVRRAFVYVDEGEIHYRYAGEGDTPLVMLHASPWSSLTLVGLIERLGRRRFVVAPDTWGNGDSSHPGQVKLEIGDYSEVLLHVMDRLELDTVDLYGTHTGASIALELCVQHPERVRKVILDGVSLRSDEMRRDMLQNYAPPLQIDWYGGHLLWAWNFQRDQFLFFPYYAKKPENRIDRPLPSPEALHSLVMEVLKSGAAYHLAYQAAFRYRPEERLPELSVPALVCAAENDPLVSVVHEAASLAQRAATAATAGIDSHEALENTVTTYEDFLDA